MLFIVNVVFQELLQVSIKYLFVISFNIEDLYIWYYCTCSMPFGFIPPSKRKDLGTSALSFDQTIDIDAIFLKT